MFINNQNGSGKLDNYLCFRIILINIIITLCTVPYYITLCTVPLVVSCSLHKIIKLFQYYAAALYYSYTLAHYNPSPFLSQLYAVQELHCSLVESVPGRTKPQIQRASYCGALNCKTSLACSVAYQICSFAASACGQVLLSNSHVMRRHKHICTASWGL